MKDNAILILSNALTNINETYGCKIKLEHRDSKDDFIVNPDGYATVKVIFNVLMALEGHTLHFYLDEENTFVIF